MSTNLKEYRKFGQFIRVNFELRVSCLRRRKAGVLKVTIKLKEQSASEIAIWKMPEFFHMQENQRWPYIQKSSLRHV